MIYPIQYVTAAAVFVCLDVAWLTIMVGLIYRPILGDILLDKPNVAAASVFYLLYPAGIVVFALAPAIASGRWSTALVSGALFGFFAYATYDLSNQATLRNWSTMLTVVDICWGTSVTAVSATLAYLATNALAKTFDL